MRNPAKLRWVLALAFLLSGLYSLSTWNQMPWHGWLEQTGFFALPFSSFPVIICAGICVAWGISVRHRILDVMVRRLFVAVSVCMVAYHFVQFSRYNYFAEDGLLFMSRVCRYLYYLPTTIMAVLLILMALRISSPARSLRRPAVWLGAACGALNVMILTNDLHRLALRPWPGDEVTYRRGSYGPVALLSFVWVGSLLLAMLIILVKNARLTAARRRIWMPVALILAGMALSGAIEFFPGSMLARAYKLPEMYNMAILAFCEGCIAIGLIPSNADYFSIFQASGLPARITDVRGNTALMSRDARPLPPEAMRAVASGPVRLDEDTWLHRQPVDGGYVYWTDNISEMNRLHDRLAETGERLEEARELLQAENELNEERTRIETKRRIYDEIAQATQPQMRRLLKLAQEARQGGREEAMRHGMILLAYIKRRANLALLAEQTPWLAVSELGVSFSESIRYLSYCDAPGMVSGRAEGGLDARLALALYDLFERLVEDALPALSGVIILLAEEDKGLRLEFQLGTPAGQTALDPWRERLGDTVTLSVKEAEDTRIIQIGVPAGSGLWQREEH